MIETIDQWSSTLVGEGVVTCTKAVADYTSELNPAELELVESSVGIRKNTYSTGRHCAKSALKAIGIEPRQYSDGLLRREDGSVTWPSGCIGSITHTNEWAMAAVAKAGSNLVSLGVDIERIDRVDKDVLKIIATDVEKETLNTIDDIRWGRVALFSIKESLYKCLRPIYGEFIRFKDVQLSDLTLVPIPVDENQVAQEVEVYCPRVKLLLPALAQCCDESRIQTRLLVLPEHVVSSVTYHA